MGHIRTRAAGERGSGPKLLQPVANDSGPTLGPVHQGEPNSLGPDRGSRPTAHRLSRYASKQQQLRTTAAFRRDRRNHTGNGGRQRFVHRKDNQTNGESLQLPLDAGSQREGHLQGAACGGINI
uniref:Uncharacterized protein n=1 Tax=Anopheles maculatus TaxID=74869 RepID=A0A182T3E3_9DIPT